MRCQEHRDKQNFEFILIIQAVLSTAVTQRNSLGKPGKDRNYCC